MKLYLLSHIISKGINCISKEDILEKTDKETLRRDLSIFDKALFSQTDEYGNCGHEYLSAIFTNHAVESVVTFRNTMYEAYVSKYGTFVSLTDEEIENAKDSKYIDHSKDIKLLNIILNIMDVIGAFPIGFFLANLVSGCNFKGPATSCGHIAIGFGILALSATTCKKATHYID